ncbi:putative carboxylesterase 3 [Colletotrichum chlorophyti]|uniref:Putative carboxylesterase 3 n=1 Tax=Colletotrichum chlorophyti TaxID=708187 RepID=A0A1Q8RQG8_9PEZI|nr:putative carboxylesterase 3 [Colletotrichum chlorophyti]
MSGLPSPDDLSRFDDFTILETAYKTVSDHSITTAVLIPKSLTSSETPNSPSPILLRYHGGFFIAASSLYPGFFQPWHMELAARHSAVIVSPNYRLAPEASIEDILRDVEDHWTWLHEKLPAFVEKETAGRVSVDTGRVLVAGESAGGYLSLMTGLSHAKEVRAVAAAYPCIDFTADHYVRGPAAPTFGVAPGSIPRIVVDGHLEKVRKGEAPAVVSEDSRLERGGLMFAVLHNGIFSELFPPQKQELFPLERVKDGEKLPRGGVFVWHGKEDCVVPAAGSVKLQKTIAEADPDLRFQLALRDGDHGFDHHAKIDDDWMAEGFKDLVKAWLE